MSSPRRPGARELIQLTLALAAAVGSVVSWLAAQSTVVVAPIAEGEPSTTSVRFCAPLVALTFALATLAGVLVVMGVARWRRQGVRPRA